MIRFWYLRYCLAVILFLLQAPDTAVASSCALTPATTWYNTISVGTYKMTFDDHNPGGPHGYAFIANSNTKILQPDGTSCMTADNVEIVTSNIFLAARQYLYMDTYSGSEDVLFVVDARNCKTIWQSPQLYGRGFGRTKAGFYLPGVGWLTIGPDCLPGKITGKPYPPLVMPPYSAYAG